MSDQYQPTSIYSWPDRNHGIFLSDGQYEYVPYDYYAGDETHLANTVFRDSFYVTFDRTAVRMTNKTDLSLFDTGGLKIYDSGTLSTHTSAAADDGTTRGFIVDEYGRVGIGMYHQNPHSNKMEPPTHDLDVRGSVGVEDYIYHNDDTDTYLLFGADETTHYTNVSGGADLSLTTDYDEINFRVGGIDMIQMLEDDVQDHVTINKRQNDVDIVMMSSTNSGALVSRGDGSEVVVNENGNSDTNFRVESVASDKMLFVDTATDVVEIRGPSGDTTDIFSVFGEATDQSTGQRYVNLFNVEPGEVTVNRDSTNTDFRVMADTADPTQNRIDVGTDGGTQTHGYHWNSHALFVDGSNGRVGLGVKTPNTTLHVAGSAHIEGDLWVKGNTNQLDTFVHVTSAMDITNKGTGPALTVTQTGSQPVAVFMDDTLPALYIEDGGSGRSGYVGFGTDSPSRNLHVHRIGTNGDDHSYIKFTTGDTGGADSDGLHVGYDASHRAIINNQENTPLEIKTGNTLAISIDGTTQHVGVGSESAYTTLYMTANDALRVPVGNTAQRPAQTVFGISAGATLGDGTGGTADATNMLGMIRYNTTNSTFEGFGPGYTWGSLGGVIDVDRDTYWTAVNDLENVHDDEFDQYDDYPGDTDYLRGFTNGLKRIAITNTGALNLYRKTGGTGADYANRYTYDTHLSISHTNNIGTQLKSSSSLILATGTDGKVNILGHDGSTKGLSLNGTLITAVAEEINLLDGETLTTAELNILDGDTAPAAITVTATDQFIINDGGNGGTMKQIDGTTLRDFTRTGFTANRAIISNSSGVLTTSNVTTTELNILDGATLSTSELNILDGATLTTGELNILDGNTAASAITVVDADQLIINDGGNGGTMKQITASTLKSYINSGFTASRVMTTDASGVPVTSDVTSTELTVIDGNTAASSITVADADRVVMNDNGTMKQVAMTNLAAYHSSEITDMPNLIGIGSTGKTVRIKDTVKIGTLGTLDASLNSTPFALEVGGNIRADGDVIAFATSDERLKTNITKIADPVDKLNQLNGYEFDWSDESEFKGHDVGVLAQEVEQVLPEVVTTRDNGHKAVKYDKMIPLLIECIKQQQIEIDQLKKQINK